MRKIKVELAHLGKVYFRGSFHTREQAEEARAEAQRTQAEKVRAQIKEKFFHDEIEEKCFPTPC